MATSDASGHPVAGVCDPAFASVRDTFAALLAEGEETGGAVAVAVDGRMVVDCWGGTADPAAGRPWTRDTIVDVYSAGKPIVALCALRLVDDGRVDLDTTLASLWPAFARHGKESVTLRQALSHQAGVMGIRDTLLPTDALFDWSTMADAVAAERPWWPPGEGVGEHALTYGHLIGEVVRRVDGRTLGRFLAEDVAGPLALEVAVGLDADACDRAATLRWAPGYPQPPGPPATARAQALANPPGALDLAVVNGTAWRRAEIPAVNLHATARGLARFYAFLGAGGAIGGGRLLAGGLVDEMLTEQARGHDRFVEEVVRWGLGVQLDADVLGPEAGHGGLGGSVGLLALGPRVALAYVTARLGDFDRVDRVAEALRDALG